MKPWWERWPHIYRREVEALDSAGIKYEIDETAQRDGRLVVELDVELDGEPLHLVARYPANFPYTRFYVFAPRVDLPRHQNPYSKELCLLPRSAIYWHLTDTLADFVLNRVDKVIAVATSTDEDFVHANEEPQGEPFSAYYLYKENTGIIIHSHQLFPEISEGRLTLGRGQNPEILAVLAIKDYSGKTLWEADQHLANQFNSERSAGRWIRLKEPPVNPYEVLEAPRVGKVNLSKLIDDGRDVVGIVYPEEVQQGVIQDGWTFITRKRRKGKVEQSLTRALRGGPEDIRSRIPELGALSDRKVALFGTGCLGAPSALQLARNGIGELRLLDCDYVEPGTTVRWPYGLSSWGFEKSSLLCDRIRRNYPYVVAAAEQLRIGDPFAVQKEMEVLDRILDGADLIYDATAEWGINLLLESLARDRNIPYVWASTTYGVWGGITGRVVPGHTGGCLCCYGYHLGDGSIAIPNEAPNGMIQPVGCSDRTFTGSSFDAELIALAAVRLAVATLCRGVDGAYPDLSWDVGVVNLRDKTGIPIPPSWKCIALTRHPNCPQHG
jgi:hypothetical protein